MMWSAHVEQLDISVNFTVSFVSYTDNTCGTMEKGEAILKREQFSGKVLIGRSNNLHSKRYFHGQLQ
jgi:hypothetical protein